MNPWEDEHGIWKTQSAFFSWIRGSLRRAWTKYPVSKNFKNSQCRPAPKGGRAKWVADCAKCGKQFNKSSLQVDHIVPAGSIRSWEDVGAFVQRLFTTSENMRLLCKPCHEMVTNQERWGLSEEEAIKRKEMVEFFKLSVSKQKEILMKNGFNEEEVKNSTLRKESYSKMNRPFFEETKVTTPIFSENGIQYFICPLDGKKKEVGSIDPFLLKAKIEISSNKSDQ